MTDIRTCAECGEALVVYLQSQDPMVDDPWHVFCDVCGGVEHPADMTTDWDGDTGCHRSCLPHPDLHLLDERCAYCGERMYTIVRGHHHTENGKDVTK